jgi:hypothetical protein
MSKRKTISQSLRFEVLKRDLFTCQYCGARAPEVILEIDHVKPVAKGGDNSIENLVAACKECNRGKRDKKLSELSEVEKSRKQIEELQEKKNMIDMIIQWKEGLNDQLEYQVDAISEVYFRLLGITDKRFNDNYRKRLKANIKKFGFSEILESTYIAVDTYGEAASNKIFGIAYNRKIEAEDPQKASLNKIKYAVLRNYDISPEYFYRRFPIHLYEEEDEKPILGILLSTNTLSNFFNNVHYYYSGDENG